MPITRKLQGSKSISPTGTDEFGLVDSPQDAIDKRGIIRQPVVGKNSLPVAQSSQARSEATEASSAFAGNKLRRPIPIDFEAERALEEGIRYGEEIKKRIADPEEAEFLAESARGIGALRGMASRRLNPVAQGRRVERQQYAQQLLTQRENQLGLSFTDKIKDQYATIGETMPAEVTSALNLWQNLQTQFDKANKLDPQIRNNLISIGREEFDTLAIRQKQKELENSLKENARMAMVMPKAVDYQTKVQGLIGKQQANALQANEVSNIPLENMRKRLAITTQQLSNAGAEYDLTVDKPLGTQDRQVSLRKKLREQAVADTFGQNTPLELDEMAKGVRPVPEGFHLGDLYSYQAKQSKTIASGQSAILDVKKKSQSVAEQTKQNMLIASGEDYLRTKLDKAATSGSGTIVLPDDSTIPIVEVRKHLSELGKYKTEDIERARRLQDREFETQANIAKVTAEQSLVQELGGEPDTTVITDIMDTADTLIAETPDPVEQQAVRQSAIKQIAKMQEKADIVGQTIANSNPNIRPAMTQYSITRNPDAVDGITAVNATAASVDKLPNTVPPSFSGMATKLRSVVDKTLVGKDKQMLALLPKDLQNKIAKGDRSEDARTEIGNIILRKGLKIKDEEGLTLGERLQAYAIDGMVEEDLITGIPKAASAVARLLGKPEYEKEASQLLSQRILDVPLTTVDGKQRRFAPNTFGQKLLYDEDEKGKALNISNAFNIIYGVALELSLKTTGTVSEADKIEQEIIDSMFYLTADGAVEQKQKLKQEQNFSGAVLVKAIKPEQTYANTVNGLADKKRAVLAKAHNETKSGSLVFDNTRQNMTDYAKYIEEIIEKREDWKKSIRENATNIHELNKELAKITSTEQFVSKNYGEVARKQALKGLSAAQQGVAYVIDPVVEGVASVISNTWQFLTGSEDSMLTDDQLKEKTRNTRIGRE